jgi:hypothetical protein
MSEKDPGWLRFYDRLGRVLLLVPAAIVGAFSVIALIVALINGQLNGERLQSICGGLVICGVLAVVGMGWHSWRMKRLRRSEQHMRDQWDRYRDDAE